MKLLDCTLRDGGYYNSWDFQSDLIQSYLDAVHCAGVDIVELGYRKLQYKGFLGACAFCSDSFISRLVIPPSLLVAVMINASEIIEYQNQVDALEALFPHSATNSPVSLIRIACHINEIEKVVPAVNWLNNRGYQVGINMMQISDKGDEEIIKVLQVVNSLPLTVLYFADSMGSMMQAQIEKIIHLIRSSWSGELGIHAHDNLGMALANTLHALDLGVTWVDSTVSGMGRGPGNARTEELAIDMSDRRKSTCNLVPLMSLICDSFKPLHSQYRWGTNLYYFLSGRYGIHPSYAQTMLGDSRYSHVDMLAVINYLRAEKVKKNKFSLDTLYAARHFYSSSPKGKWNPKDIISERSILILGTGPGIKRYRDALECFINEYKPLVLALNVQSDLDLNLIDMFVACHPVRLLADCDAHSQLKQPLITPYSMLPEYIRKVLCNKSILDFGLVVRANTFAYNETHCIVPTSLVMAYAFAIAAAGNAADIYIAGFDGYPGEDPRNAEMNTVIQQFQSLKGSPPITSITPSRYQVIIKSVYGIINEG